MRAHGVVGQFRRRPLSVAAAFVLSSLALVALFADVIASDKPLLARVGGRTFILPALTDPIELRGENNHSLRLKADWLVEPLLPYGPNQTYAEQPGGQSGAPPWPPDAEHPLGTDELGRDVLARIVHGARVSLTVGFVAVGLYVLIGVALGAIAGWYGRWVDAIVSRLIEITMTFPTLFFVLAVMALMRVQSLWPLTAVIALTRWTDVARLVRAEVMRLKGLEFVQAARAMGASDLRIIMRHLLPNALGPVLVASTFGVASAIVVESALSFLGFGAPPPSPSWGELLTQAHRYVVHPGAWWLTLYPGLAIFLTVTAFNLVGEGLRDAIDPRLRQ